MSFFIYAQAHMEIRHEWDMKGLGTGMKAGIHTYPCLLTWE
jgi:hypothetical protein